MKRKGTPMNGWLVLDKPAGMTSTQAMAKARWLLGAAKAGHGGTLDPLATGILPIAFGEATKTVSYVMDGRKTYQFTLKWGEQRSTDDAEGAVVATSDVRPSREAVLVALPSFVGAISQIPPQVSAIKVEGERAYDLARAGEEFELLPRIVDVYRYDLIEFSENEASFEVECGKGTYMRALARDLAVKLGTVAHITVLRRLAVARFTLKNAISLDELAQKAQNTPAAELLLPVETALDDIPALVLSLEEAQRLRLGQRLSLLSSVHRDRLMSLPQNIRQGEAPVVALCEGKAVALAEIVAGELRTVRVLHG